VPHTSQVECDWHNTYSYSTYAVSPPDQCGGYTSSVRWTLQSQWFDCHGTLKQNDVWGQTCQYQAGQGGQTVVKYETVTTYTQQWVDTSYWAWQ
jgi:DnaJ-class molecular chaperone